MNEQPHVSVQDELNTSLKHLSDSQASHYNIATTIKSPLAPIDLLAFAVVKRSFSLIYGFHTLIEAKNFPCAVPLIRLQIDNLLRFRAAFMTTDADEFAANVLSGQEVSNLKAKDGKLMRDLYLKQQLETEYPWLEAEYKRASGYVHLSEQHFLNIIDSLNDEGKIRLYVGPDDQLIDTETYLGATITMITVTHALLTCLVNWANNRQPVQNQAARSS